MTSLFAPMLDNETGADESITLEQYSQYAASKGDKHHLQMFYELHIELQRRFGGASCHPAELVPWRERCRRAVRIMRRFDEVDEEYQNLEMLLLVHGVDSGYFRLWALAKLGDEGDDVGYWPEKAWRSKDMRLWVKNELVYWLRNLPSVLICEADCLQDHYELQPPQPEDIADDDDALSQCSLTSFPDPSAP
ncbi:hypothetical protein ACHAPT_006014 [Fusarium lateritium]